MSTEPRDRDWDAEFAQITRYLDLDAASESATRRGAHRDLFEPTSDETTPMTPASPAPAGDGPVPGFRPQWRAGRAAMGDDAAASRPGWERYRSTRPRRSR